MRQQVTCIQCGTLFSRQNRYVGSYCEKHRGGVDSWDTGYDPDND